MYKFKLTLEGVTNLSYAQFIAQKKIQFFFKLVLIIYISILFQVLGAKDPDDFVCVKTMKSRMGLSTGKESSRVVRDDKLFMHKSQVDVVS